MKWTLTFISAYLIFLQSFGQSPDSISSIVEFKRAEYTILSLDKTILKFKYRIKITNSRDEKFGDIEIPFDDNTLVASFKGSLIDASGKKIKKISKSDLRVVSNFGYYSLYTDDKLKKYSFHYFNFPYTIEYEYSLEFHGFLGCWFLLDDYDLPSKTTELVIKTPADFDYYYRIVNYLGIETTLTEGTTKITTWKAENSKAIFHEEFSKGLMDLFPAIYMSPKQFRYGGYFGLNDSWENYGKWSWSLLENRNVLPSETILKIHQLTDSVKDTINKIKCIYSYLQESTRYISIQKGISGFQPASATDVDINKYGDCKALSNYLKSLLAVIGVKAIYTEIGNGENQKIKWQDFPNVYQINHVILCIPGKQDTIWLECTSKHVPFGYIGNGNSNRKALCIAEDGGRIVNTPKYSLYDNFQKLKAVIMLNKDGSMECQANYLKSGILMDNLIYLKGLDRKDQEKIIYEEYPSVNMEIKEYTISKTNEVFPKMCFDIKMKETNYSSKTSNLYTFNPNYLNRFINPFTLKSKRENDLYISYGCMFSDTIKFSIPEHFKPEYLPELKTLESIFGKYHIECRLVKDELVYIRNCQFNEGTFTKDKYLELFDFYNTIQTLDNQNVIFSED